MELHNKKKTLLTIGSIVLLFIVLTWMQRNFDGYKIRIVNLCAINIILALSLNLTNGFTGLFSLGTAGFMAIGAYTSAILTMSREVKEMNFFMTPMSPALLNINTSFFVALLLAGLFAGVAGYLIGSPVLKLRGDYLAIATLGFGEIISVIFTNLQTITNGALGLKGLPEYTNIYWSWAIAVLVILGFSNLMNSSYGSALKSIREDETAAQAMGINLYSHKILAFTISAFLAGIGGALLANLLSTIDPTMFRFFYTYQVLLIVVLGGMGSITGSVVSGCIMAVLMEALRSVESTLDLGFMILPGIPGMRMVIFSIILVSVVLFLPNGIMGEKELSLMNILSKRRSGANESTRG
ncbi:MAG TPA: branched-chain amino acid ABC transporter permease [Thermoclostridium caenicola]|uniref:branched-chain amino acid ABC transporter permease n=1 Tax=Thermoclostridium caenicola TaxID=659425 RepID=UPI002D0AEA45|nr:branched-chain amino acid ABC transporter permease [Thermoclostridium caenicola]HPO76116.1 branched-chain amino acid ABC transporter permease [Thermoclostridium caenicola]